MKRVLLFRFKKIIKKLIFRVFAGNYESFIEHQINAVEQEDFFTTFYTRRISPDKQILQNTRIQSVSPNYVNQKIGKAISPRFGIVVQGPVCIENDFTSRVISRYLDLYPEAFVIFSTWVGEDLKLKDLDTFNLNSKFRVLINEKPANPGFSNINLQIESTRNGLKLTKELNCDFGIKTRSDQAFLNPYSLDLLHFELTDAKRKYNQNERLVVVSLDTFLFRPYGISDMFQFGKVDTLLDYWDIEFDHRNPKISPELNAVTLRDYSKLKLAECYLTSSYLLKKNVVPDFSLRQSLELIRDYFIIVDQQAIDLVWNKYTHKEFRYRSDVYPSKLQEIQNWEWRAMQSNLEELLEFEFLLDYPHDF